MHGIQGFFCTKRSLYFNSVVSINFLRSPCGEKEAAGEQSKEASGIVLLLLILHSFNSCVGLRSSWEILHFNNGALEDQIVHLQYPCIHTSSFCSAEINEIIHRDKKCFQLRVENWPLWKVLLYKYPL